MRVLSSEIDQFLESVASVSELQASDAALVDAARALSDPSATRMKAGGCETPEAVRQKLWFISELRREIAEAIARIRAQEALQVLGEDSHQTGA